MSLQRPLAGEYKLVMHVYGAGRAQVYVIHNPPVFSPYSSALLCKFGFDLSDDELLAGDWGHLLIRAAEGAEAGL